MFFSESMAALGLHWLEFFSICETPGWLRSTSQPPIATPCLCFLILHCPCAGHIQTCYGRIISQSDFPHPHPQAAALSSSHPHPLHLVSSFTYICPAQLGTEVSSLMPICFFLLNTRIHSHRVQSSQRTHLQNSGKCGAISGVGHNARKQYLPRLLSGMYKNPAFVLPSFPGMCEVVF